MRAAAILGLGSSAKNLKPFQKDTSVSWLVGLPANATDADAVLIFGGDGAVHRHLAQLVKLQLPVLVVPCGSGNDFARALNLRSVAGALAAWQKFLAGGGNVRAFDLGMIRPVHLPQGPKADREGPARGTAEAVPFPVSRYSNPEDNSKYFCCVGGVGLDGEVARRANELPRWLRRHGGYALSLLPTVLRFAALPMTILVPSRDGTGVLVERSAKPTVLAAFANTPTYGGGMNIAPRAQLDDGLLDVCVVSDIDKLRLFCLFPTVYFGRHLEMKEVEYFQSDQLRLETEKPLDVYADGEYVCQTPIEVTVARRALQVIVP